MDTAEITAKLNTWFDRILDYSNELEVKNLQLDDDFYQHAIINFLNYAKSQRQLAEVMEFLNSEDGKESFEYDMNTQMIFEKYQEICWDIRFDIMSGSEGEDTVDLTEEKILEGMRNFLDENPENLNRKVRFA